MKNRKSINAEQFNRMVYAILIRYSAFLEIPSEQINEKIKNFNQQLQKDEQSIQQRQNDETSVEQV